MYKKLSKSDFLAHFTEHMNHYQLHTPRVREHIPFHTYPLLLIASRVLYIFGYISLHIMYNSVVHLIQICSRRIFSKFKKTVLAYEST